MNIEELRNAYFSNQAMPGWIAGYLNDRKKGPIYDLELIAVIVQVAIWNAVGMFIYRGDVPRADEIWKKVEALTTAAKIMEENPELVGASLSLALPPDKQRPSISADRLCSDLEAMAGYLIRANDIHDLSARRLNKRNTFFYCLGYALTRPHITKAMKNGDVRLPLPTTRSAAALYAIVQSILVEHAPHALDGMVREYPTEHDPQIMRLMKAGCTAAQKAKSHAQEG